MRSKKDERPARGENENDKSKPIVPLVQVHGNTCFSFRGRRQSGAEQTQTSLFLHKPGRVFSCRGLTVEVFRDVLPWVHS